MWKHHAPWHIGYPPPQLPIDEVSDTSCPEANWKCRGKEIGNLKEGAIGLLCIPIEGDQYTDKATVE